MNAYRNESHGNASAPIRFDGQVAIVTGAGSGLGRSHAMQLAARGAAVLVQDGAVTTSSGAQVSAAEQVASAIRQAGGQALASSAPVTDPQGVCDMVALALREWKRVDILVNNAGVQRDQTFSAMRIEDFRAVIDEQLMGAIHCTKAVWDIMKAQRYGRIVLTTSASGLFGSVGQASDGAAKMALVGLMHSLALEANLYGIRVNCLAPTIATHLTQDLSEIDQLDLPAPENVSPGLLYLVSRDAPTKTILCAGGGSFSCSNISLTDGVFIGTGPDAAESLAARAAMLFDREGERSPASGGGQAILDSQGARHYLHASGLA